MHIRVATHLDSEAVREVYLHAFSEAERQKVAVLAVDLLSEETKPETISLVAEADSVVVGHVAFSPVTIDNNSWFGYILAPLGVRPDYQKRRIGSSLVEDGIAQLSKMDVDIVFVYGDPQYYGRFGFSADVASMYFPPYELQHPFGWQALSLRENVLSSEPVTISCVAPLRDSELW